MQTLAWRMIGAAGLRRRSYEEVESDYAATGSAIAVVVVSSIAAAIGVGGVDPRMIAGIVAASILTWLVWVGLTLFIGTRLLPESTTYADFGQVLRTTGFSASVGILRVLGVIPVIGPTIFAIVTVWMLLTFVVAIRQALDFGSTTRAFAVCLLGWTIHGLLFFGFVRAVI
jgi:hypothetical protein